MTPRIVVHEPEKLVEFMRHAFAATAEVRAGMPSEVRLGDSIIMVSGAGARAPMPAFLYIYVDDVDATYRSALEAGASALEAPRDLPYGDRRGMVSDAWGNIWQIATHMEDLSLEEIRRRTSSEERAQR